MPIRERIVYDRLDPCPYIEGEISCMPLRRQFVQLTPSEFDTSLSAGDRRVGQMLYHTQCPFCSACEAIRVPVQEFKRSRSQRKVWKKGKDIVVEIGNPICNYKNYRCTTNTNSCAIWPKTSDKWEKRDTTVGLFEHVPKHRNFDILCKVIWLESVS